MSGDRWLDSWAPPPAIEYRLQQAPEIKKVAIEAPRTVRGGRWIDPKPKAEPRGGDDRFRAAAKAARKARQNQRKRK